MKNTSLLIVLLTGFVFITFVIEVSSNCAPEAKEDCGEHKQCVKQGENNTYHCVCKEGFTTLEDSCQDLDECQKRDIRTKCKRKGARCKNTPGSYTCKCPRGFVMHLEADYCKDIDECEDEPCHHKAVCQNERGSYTCTCVKGFAGDGHECVEDLAYKQKQKIKQIMTIGGAAGGGTLFLIALIACFLGARKKKPKEEKVEDADSTLTVHSRWESSEESDDDDE
ncbi:hypothetical protein pdam_00016413 [Pocillopora damicornis]|uniref:EGF-like domain-containing protein n=1 Tax=Pocillopora damicornis TaxID=46731 RepID=A0A3M6TC52_POCDA|nr:uromodulin-like [Pocillopora damicornis]RMX38953.1 hypothetical protein pdam_00016413 [Pocillopora damicornis]